MAEAERKIDAPRTASIRGRVVRLVLALLIPALLLAAGLIYSLERQAARTQERQLAATARTLALVVDARIGEQVATLNALAVSNYLAEGDWPRFADQAREALQHSDAWVVVREPSGRQLLNTFETDLPPAPLIPGLRSEPTWSGVRTGAKVSDVIWGPVAHANVVVVMKRVALADGRSVNLSVVLPASSFAKLLGRQELPGRWIATILDGQRRVVGRNRGGAEYVGRRASPDLLAALAAQPRAVVRSHTFDGVPVMTAFDQLPGYGWTALVAMPRDEALGADRGLVLVAGLAGVVLLTVAVLFALRIGRQIARPVQGLALAASEWEAGRSTDFPTDTGLAETDRLSRAFASALATVRERDERQKLLINELNHRVKNTLATVQAVAQHTSKGATSIQAYHAALEGRVIAMSRAHELLTRSAWEGAELGDLARTSLNAFIGPQLTIEGPPVQVEPIDALNLALILYELATNASKHGALSNADGQVRLSWAGVAGQTRVSWRESGGPAVIAPTRTGFGSRLVSRATRDLQPSKFSFDPDGVVCEFTLRTRAGD